MWYNSVVKFILQSPLHGLLGSALMLINYTGRKSGKPYSVPVNFIYEEADILLTTSLKQRVWWRSLRGNAAVTVRLGGKDVPATTEVYEDEKSVVYYLNICFDRSPRMAGYLEVPLDENGRADPDALTAAAASRVIVRTILQQPNSPKSF